MTSPTEPRPKARLRRPGYFQCRRILERLRRFQDLVRHDQRWAYEIEQARPLEQLLPPGTKPEHQGTEIDRQIRRLMPIVAIDLKRAGIHTEIEWPNQDYDPTKHRVVETPADRRYHIITDYFRMPRDGYASAFTEVIGAVDMAIGFYEDLERRAKAEWWNPLAWIAHLLYAPAWVLERAGFVDLEEPRSALLVVYIWLLRILFVIGIALILKKLGLGDLIRLIHL